MRSRLLGSLVIVLLAAYGCGSSGPKSDARDATSSDGGDGASESRPDTASDTRADVGTTDATTDRGDASPDLAGDGGGPDLAPDANRDTGADVRVDGGNDGAAPTCTDGIKNSDETGIDCGGHCGKCGPGQGCAAATDCQFAICKPDMTCGACSVAADCSGGDTECQMRTCTAGVCGTVRVAAGTVLTVQTSGDCKHRQCDASGGVMTVNDDTDVPNDSNPCTNDLCSGGIASHTNVASNTNCGGTNICNGSGQCVGCTAASDCPGTDTPCRTRTCSAQGVCGVTLTAAGTKLTDPTAGDCRGLSCDGAGNSQIYNEDTDLPVDGNACTTDECSAGTASHRPVASGMSCGGTLVCDGASHCVACVVASTCPGTDTECHMRTCIANVCGITNAPAGTALASQTAKDCKKNQCDGNGGTQVVSDNTDVPVDNNPCTADICTVGMPSNPFVSSGTTCGTGSMICDGQGACVGCVIASNCPGTDTECHTRTCVANICGVTNQPTGTLLFSQTAGDCKKNQCDGNGGTQTVADNTDKPVDNNACTTDVCTNGAPSNPPVASGTSCGTSQLCDGAGACVGCLTASDCAGTDTTCRTRTCVNNQCGATNAPAGTPLPAQIAGDCKKDQCDGAGQVVTVADNTDKPVDGITCTQDVCAAGLPTNPPEAAGTTCAQSGGSRCNGGGACVQCLQASDCAGTDTECHVRTCTNGMCGVNNIAAGTAVNAQTAGDCKKNVCNGSGAITTATDNTDLPVDGNECTMDVCTNGTPSHPAQPANATCAQNGGTRCNGSSTAPACVQCLQATDCSGTDTECHARTCTAGVCGVNNTASGTAVASQTAGDCKKNVCNGSGAIAAATDNTDVPVDGNSCTQDVCNAGVPSNPPVTSGTACNQNGGSVCDASGACVQCVVATTCPGTDTTCHTRTCTSGTCGVNNAASGTLVTVAPAGDCKKSVCDGTGNVITAVDDTDLPTSTNQCLQNVCTNGVVSNPPQALNTSCNQSGGSLCNGAGTCVQCNVASTCPGGPDTTCHTRTCISGVCGVSNAASGTADATQTAGDCHKNVCNGSGGITSAIDNTDLPVDGNACSQDVCTNGVPSNPSELAGTSCGQNGGSTCNGSGSCVECNVASTCPGTDTACHSRTCSNGACGISNVALGTLVSNAPAGNCHKDVCDGLGNVTTVVDDTDVPATSNQCLQSVCSNGTPSNPPQAADATCNQNGGNRCDGGGSCVECNMASTCPGSDTTCQTRTCTNGLCGFSFAASGTAVGAQTFGDCHKNVCDGAGSVTSVVDNTDVPPTGNQCLQSICTNGTPSNPPRAVNVACNQGGGSLCDGAGSCVQCNMASTCLGSDTTCQTRTCVSGVCGVSFAAAGTFVSDAVAGDCLKDVCDGGGSVITVANDTDLPVTSNQCLQSLCNNGVPSNPPVTAATTCNQNGGSQCDGAGSCVVCLAASECPGGPDTECHTRTCTAGACGFSFAPMNTVVASQTAGDCQDSVCDGAGSVISIADDSDVPVNNNDCTTVMCLGGGVSTTNIEHGTTCATSGGRTCDGLGSCLLTFSVVRSGDGAAALTTGSTAVFVEERKVSDGSLVGTAIALPTANSGSNLAFTNSGSANSEGGLSLSVDGRYLIMGGYNAAPGVAGIVNTTSVATNRVVARIDASGAVDTSTRLNGAFSANNIRGATSFDGSAFWAAGAGGVTGGLWYVTIGSLGSGTQVLTNPTSVRWPHIIGGQLYASAQSGTFTNVFTIGSGMPTTVAQTATSLPGMPTATASPFSFVFFDRDGTVAGVDTLYVADDGNATFRGIQKWTLATTGGTWTKATTFSAMNPAATGTIGFRGLAGLVTGSNVTLVGSTDEAVSRLIVFVDTGALGPVGTVIGTAATNTAWRGIALAPHR